VPEAVTIVWSRVRRSISVLAIIGDELLVEGLAEERSARLGPTPIPRGFLPGAAVSTPPPAAIGTTNVIGRVG
jgi:hypothetical protein